MIIECINMNTAATNCQDIKFATCLHNFAIIIGGKYLITYRGLWEICCWDQIYTKR